MRTVQIGISMLDSVDSQSITLLSLIHISSAGSVVSKRLPKTARIPSIIPGSDVHIGFIVAIILVVLTYWFMYKTRWGYEIRLVGENSKFAKYAGINIGFVFIASQMLGGRCV